MCFHTLLTVYVGLPLPRQFHSPRPIIWKAIKIRIFKCDYSMIAVTVASFCENMAHKKDEYYNHASLLP